MERGKYMTQTLITSPGDLISQSLEFIKKYEPPEGYYLAFSGGKDSIVCYDLLEKAGVSFDAHYAVTTIDPPELTTFIRENYPNVIWHRPTYKGKPTNYYQLIQLKGLPNRRVRWCCAYLKETEGKNRTVVVGVRSEESRNRAKLPLYDTAGGGKHILRPILHWKTIDIWEYIKNNALPYCSLYDQGYDRIGCILCPLQCIRKRITDMNRYPKHVAAIKRSLSLYLQTHPESSLFQWGDTVEEIFTMWIAETPATDDSGQCTLSSLGGDTM